MGGESSLGAKVSGISLLIISPASNAHFSDVKRREYFNIGEKILEKARHWALAGGAQNESSGENGEAFCEKAAGEEVIISRRSLFCAISHDMLLQWRGSKYKYKYEYKCKYNYKYRYKYK